MNPSVGPGKCPASCPAANSWGSESGRLRREREGARRGESRHAGRPALLPGRLLDQLRSLAPDTVQVGDSYTLGCLAFNKVYDLNLALLTPSLQASEGNKNVEVVYSFPSWQGDPLGQSLRVRVRVNAQFGCVAVRTHAHTRPHAHARGRGGTFRETGCHRSPWQLPRTSNEPSARRPSSEEATPALGSGSLLPAVGDVGRSLVRLLGSCWKERKVPRPQRTRSQGSRR